MSVLALLAAAGGVRGDDLLHRYDGDVLPYDPSTGWLIGNPCEDECSEHLENGHFVMEWTNPGGDIAYYHFSIAFAPEPLPPSLWVECRYRSNTPLPSGNQGCDSRLTVTYRRIPGTIWLHGDAVFNFGGFIGVTGLPNNTFRTFRFESPDGLNFTYAVDGRVFWQSVGNINDNNAYVQFGGKGFCGGDAATYVNVNEWDFIRFGTMGDQEQIVSVDPPPGDLLPAQAQHLSSIVITFDKPAYLYVDDIDVSVTGGIVPSIAATRRLDNGEPEVLEVVLEGRLSPGETMTLTFDTGTGPQTISYTRIIPEIPATSAWGLVAVLVLGLTVGVVILRHRPVPA